MRSGRGASCAWRTAGALALAVLLPGCFELPEEDRALLEVFVVVLSVNVFLNLVLILLILFYFLPFTRPGRRKRK